MGFPPSSSTRAASRAKSTAAAARSVATPANLPVVSAIAILRQQPPEGRDTAADDASCFTLTRTGIEPTMGRFLGSRMIALAQTKLEAVMSWKIVVVSQFLLL